MLHVAEPSKQQVDNPARPEREQRYPFCCCVRVLATLVLQTMSYEVIARKWRPQNFEQLIGQDHVGVTLLNAIKNDRLHHALLFTGPRGTGKTSTARILAKSLRCTQAQNYVPCNQCSDCLSIQQGNNVDVLEIDGASNNGVDAIRQLRDNVQYTASSGQYKVYIIDEVHMLSGSAFNALLKTLEEPPAHVVFMMATTEVQKIPLTILSRCQRYNFRRISTKLIASHLLNICKSDKVTAEEDAIWLIAKHADGSMRDAQSLLDQVITFLSGNLSYDAVVSALGLTDRVLVWDAFWACIERDPTKAIQIISKLNQSGFDPKLFFEELLALIRSALLVQTEMEQAREVLDMGDSELKSLEQAARSCSANDLHMIFDMAQKGIHDILTSFEPRLVFDVVLLRLTQAPQFADLKGLLRGEAQALPAPQSSAKTTNSRPSQAPGKGSTNKTRPISVNPERWVEFIEKVRSQDPVFAAKIEPLAMKHLEGQRIELAIPKQYAFLKMQFQSPELLEKLKGWLKQVWQTDFEVKIIDGQESHSGAVSAVQVVQQKQQQADEQLLQQMLAHPKVRAASSVFKGRVQLLSAQPDKGVKK